jgi:hypothetical protein
MALELSVHFEDRQFGNEGIAATHIASPLKIWPSLKGSYK